MLLSTNEEASAADYSTGAALLHSLEATGGKMSSLVVSVVLCTVFESSIPVIDFDAASMRS